MATVYSLATTNTTSALIVENTCKTVDAIYSRGSGQDLESDEAKRFKQQIEDRIKNPIGINYYELGTETYGGHKYQAIDVNNALNGNPIGAAASSGYAFDYGRSVDSGVGELYSKL